MQSDRGQAALRLSPVRRQALHTLSGPAQLVHVHAGRFDDAASLVNSWLDGLDKEATALSVELAADPALPEEDIWARIQYDLGAPSDKTAITRAGSAFQSLCSSIYASDRKVVLVLDLGEAVSDPATHLGSLLDNAPEAGIKIVLVTHTVDPQLLSLVRQRRQKSVAPDDMLFDTGDVAATLRTLDLEFDGRAPDVICDVTGGLAALVDAVCNLVPTESLLDPSHLAAHARSAVDSYIDNSLRADPALAAYRDAILLSAAASPLKHDPAGLLDDGASPGSTPLYETIAHSNMVNIAGSPTEPVLCYPAAVQESLLRLAAAHLPGRLREYRIELAKYWLEAGRADYSIRHSADAENWQMTIETMVAHFSALYTRDYPVTMSDQVLLRIPETLISKNPLLIATRTMLEQFSNPRGGLPNVFSKRAPLSDEADPIDLLIEMTTLRLEGKFTESADLCDVMVQSLIAKPEFPNPVASEAWAVAYVHIGISYILTGRFLDAIPVLKYAMKIDDSSFVHRDAAGKLALCNTFIANRTEAQRWVTEERRAPTLPPVTERLVRPAGDVAASLTALDQLDIDSAAAILHSLGRPDDREEFWGFILYAQASLSLLSDSAAGGLRFLELNKSPFQSMSDPNEVSAPLLAAIGAELHLACDQPDAAAARLVGSTHPITAPVRARLALLTNDPKAAEDIARRSLMAVECTARDAVDLNLTAAAALLAAGQQEQATHFLDNAVAGMQRSGFLRPVRTLPPRILRQLSRINPELPIESEMSRQEFGTLTITESDEPDPTMEESAQPLLTTREFAVLRDLTTEASVREISMRQSVSVSTIKTQVRSIYRKLDVNSRPAAVAAAREFGLLD